MFIRELVSGADTIGGDLYFLAGFGSDAERFDESEIQ